MLQNHFSSRTNPPPSTVLPISGESWRPSPPPAVTPGQYRAAVDSIRGATVHWSICGGGCFHGRMVEQRLDASNEKGKKAIVELATAIDEGGFLFGVDVGDALGRQALVTVGMAGGEPAVIKVRKLGRAGR
jgi:hypothetical protein